VIEKWKLLSALFSFFLFPENFANSVFGYFDLLPLSEFGIAILNV